MCGIVGYIGRHAASPVLLEGLRKLEYRGYDSAGLALLNEGASGFVLHKRVGRVANIVDAVSAENPLAQAGISHTRWATHGGVTEANAHPHLSWDGQISLVHNGVIENYQSLRRQLEQQGVTFRSETDTEVLTNLIALSFRQLDGGRPPAERLLEAVRQSLALVEGTYGIAVMAWQVPDRILTARKGSPLCIGVGNGEHLIASDVSAFLGRTRSVVYLEDGQVAVVGRDDFSVATIADAAAVEAVIQQIDWNAEDAELGAHQHFMEKEIFEQPRALENAMRGRFSDDHSTAKFGGLNLEPREWRQIDRLVFAACGTARHACMVAEHLVETYARIPVEVEHASEFRYRNAPLGKDTMVFVMSQSGETIDTLEALREAHRKGHRVLGITNGVGSTIARETEGGIYQHAGPEIGVASTKAFTSQVLIAGMLALYLGRMRDLSFQAGREMVQAFRGLPNLVSIALQQAPFIKEIASRYAHYEDMLFLGRQDMYPVALEGALKLKEISYMHAEGYPAAELKHGPIALLCEQCPCVFLAPDGPILPKVISNVQEARARGAKVIAVVTEGGDFPPDGADDIIAVPRSHESITPILMTIPLQLLAYYIAVIRKCDVDKPRNLAKSVTVE